MDDTAVSASIAASNGRMPWFVRWVMSLLNTTFGRSHIFFGKGGALCRVLTRFARLKMLAPSFCREPILRPMSNDTLIGTSALLASSMVPESIVIYLPWFARCIRSLHHVKTILIERTISLPDKVLDLICPINLPLFRYSLACLRSFALPFC